MASFDFNWKLYNAKLTNYPSSDYFAINTLGAYKTSATTNYICFRLYDSRWPYGKHAVEDLSEYSINLSLEVSYDKETWVSIDLNEEVPFNNGHDVIYVRGIGSYYFNHVSLSSRNAAVKLETTDFCYLSGKLSSLIDYTNMGNIQYLPANSGIESAEHNTSWFYIGLFADNTDIIDTKFLDLDFTIAEHANAYQFMFQNCSNLIAAPKELPILEVKQGTYIGMFKNCINLRVPPEIKATSYETSNYPTAFSNMFQNCKNLTKLPEIKISEISGSYFMKSMFEGCTSLKVSQTQTAECPNAYRVPAIGQITPEPTTNFKSCVNMFKKTSGTFIGNPEVYNSITYYLVPSGTYYINLTVI